MRNIVAARIPLARQGLALLLLCAVTTNSGCVTTLGYIPEHPKPMADTTTITPKYGEVKKWAYDVLDGYDSRATMNRNAIYGGALIAAAAVSAIAGLAAFDSGSSALIGIPIGTTFLGSVAAIYSSEEKAHIYRLASEYVKDLITASDERFAKRRLLVTQKLAASMLEKAQMDLGEADKRLLLAKQEETSQKAQADAKRAEAGQAAAGPEKDALTKSAQALEQLAKKATSTMMEAQAARDAAEERVNNAKRRYEALNTLTATKKKLADLEAATPKNSVAIDAVRAELAAAEQVWDHLTNSEMAEALCLRKDINDVMRRVEEHKALLDPKNIVDRLKNVRAPAPVTPGDLSNLMLPVKSRCDNAI